MQRINNGPRDSYGGRKKTYHRPPIDITARMPAAGEKDRAEGEETHGGSAGNYARASVL